MSFGGGTPNLPEAPPKPLGVDERRLASSEQARPVPYMAGRIRISANFISDIFDVRTIEVTRSVGKQRAKVGTNYFGSFAALLCHGPLESIQEVWLNSEKVWLGDVTRAANPVSATITISGFGNFEIFWGTEAQEPDGYLIGKSGIIHPAYRGIAYMTFHQLFFGFNQTNVQNIELLVTRKPQSAWFTQVSVGNDANPIGVAIEWLQNPRFGLGLSTDMLDTAVLTNTAVQLSDEGFGIAPWLVRGQEVKQLLTLLLEYIDGYITISTEGKMGIKLIRSPASLAGLQVVDQTMMIRKPEFSPVEWGGAINETRVRFSDRTLEYKENIRAWRDRGSFSITGEFNALNLDRTWVARPDLARHIAVAAGRAAAVPPVTGTLHLRRIQSVFVALTPGSLFKLTYAPRGFTDVLCRVIERTVPNTQQPEFTVQFRLDRSYLTPTGTAAEASVPEEETPVAEQIASARIVELPPELSPDGAVSLATLAMRPDQLTVGYVVHLGENYDFSGEIEPQSYQPLGVPARFACYGTLQEDFPQATETIDLYVGMLVQLTGPDLVIDEQQPFDALANDLLVFVGDEILSVHSLTLVAMGKYRLQCVRARFATKQQAHSNGAAAYLIYRHALPVFQHPQFKVNNVAKLKLQSYTGKAASDIATALNPSHTLGGTVFKAYQPTNIIVNGDSQHPTYSAGAPVTISLTLTDPGRDLYQKGRLKFTTVLEIWNEETGLTGTQALPDGESSIELDDATLLTLLGGLQRSFTVKAKTKIESEEFVLYSETTDLFVTLV